MPKVTIHAGFTLHVGHPSINEYGRVDVEIKDIETSLPLEPQLNEVSVALGAAFGKLNEVLDQQAHEIIGVTIKRSGES